MNRKDILQMGRQAGALIELAQEKDLLWLERFAALVASAEREACAKVCDEIYFQNYPDAEKWERSEEGEAIRKRSHV